MCHLQVLVSQLCPTLCVESITTNKASGGDGIPVELFQILDARDGVSREVPCSALKGETVPDSLPATPKSPPWSHHFMGNRWGNSGNSVRLYFGGLQNHCIW